MLTKHSLVEHWAIQHYDQFLAFDSSSSFYVQFKEEEFFGQFYHTILQSECSIKRKKYKHSKTEISCEIVNEVNFKNDINRRI